MVLRKKKGKVTERRGSIVKCGEMLFERSCENPTGLSICDGPMEIVFIKRWILLKR